MNTKVIRESTMYRLRRRLRRLGRISCCRVSVPDLAQLEQLGFNRLKNAGAPSGGGHEVHRTPLGARNRGAQGPGAPGGSIDPGVPA